jgi:hypothetical protein
MEVGYKLLGVSPTRWGELDDPACPPRFWRGYMAPQTGTTVVNINSPGVSAVAGTLTALAATSTNNATKIPRIQNLTAAPAGSIAVLRTTAVPPLFSFRGRQTTVLSAVTAGMRWFLGWTSTAIASDVDPATALNSIGIGRGAGEANVQLYHNDGSGAATQVDLGAGFPAATLNSGYEIHALTRDNVTWGVAVRNVNTQEEVSAALSTNVPATASMYPMLYASNGADAVQVSADVCFGLWCQLTR